MTLSIGHEFPLNLTNTIRDRQVPTAMHWLFSRRSNYLATYFGLFSARAEFDVHSASVAALQENMCKGGSGYTPFCPAGLTSHNQTYKYVKLWISERNTRNLCYRPKPTGDNTIMEG